jgi:phosphohistidine phosphatase
MTAPHQLIVMRHAKAGDLPGGPDFERALRPRGSRNATAAGGWLAARGLVPDLVLCSQARRARQTWQLVSAELPAESEVISDPRLYQADASDLIDLMASVGGHARSLMYVGHNPAAADLIEMLTGEPADVPTAAVAIIDVPGPWSELASAAGTLVALWTPRSDQA